MLHRPDAVPHPSSPPSERVLFAAAALLRFPRAPSPRLPSPASLADPATLSAIADAASRAAASRAPQGTPDGARSAADAAGYSARVRALAAALEDAAGAAMQCRGASERSDALAAFETAAWGLHGAWEELKELEEREREKEAQEFELGIKQKTVKVRT